MKDELANLINLAIVRHTGPDYDPYPLRDELIAAIRNAARFMTDPKPKEPT